MEAEMVAFVKDFLKQNKRLPSLKDIKKHGGKVKVWHFNQAPFNGLKTFFENHGFCDREDGSGEKHQKREKLKRLAGRVARDLAAQNRGIVPKFQELEKRLEEKEPGFRQEVLSCGFRSVAECFRMAGILPPRG